MFPSRWSEGPIGRRMFVTRTVTRTTCCFRVGLLPAALLVVVGTGRLWLPVDGAEPHRSGSAGSRRRDCRREPVPGRISVHACPGAPEYRSWFVPGGCRGGALAFRGGSDCPQAGGSHVVPPGGTRVFSSSVNPGFRLRLILGNVHSAPPGGAPETGSRGALQTRGRRGALVPRLSLFPCGTVRGGTGELLHPEGV